MNCHKLLFYFFIFLNSIYPFQIWKTLNSIYLRWQLFITDEMLRSISRKSVVKKPHCNDAMMQVWFYHYCFALRTERITHIKLIPMSKKIISSSLCTQILFVYFATCNPKLSSLQYQPWYLHVNFWQWFQDHIDFEKFMAASAFSL